MTDHYDFRKELARELIARHTSRMSRKGRRSTTDVENRLTERHFPSLIPAQEGAKNPRPCRKCVVCNKERGMENQVCQGNERRRATGVQTVASPYVWMTEHFRGYHTLKNYKLYGGDDSESDDSDQ